MTATRTPSLPTSFAALAAPVASTRRRAQALFDADYASVLQQIDRFFAGLLLFQWVAAVATAAWISPRTWAGSTSSIHPHVWVAVLLGGLIISVPVALAILRPGQTITRHCIAIGQMLFSALLIHLMQGRIEMHFHIFGSLAFLAFYRDWRVLVTATVIVALDHLLRGMYWPQSIYGVDSGAQWRWLEHSGWVLFEDAFLMVACVRGRREMQCMALRQAEIEEKNHDLTHAIARAEQSDRAKSEFLAHMSHELRTPLNGVIGMTDVLLSSNLDERQAGGARLIRRSAQSLTAIVDDVLDLAEIEAGRLKLQPIQFSPENLLQQTLELFAQSAETKRLQLQSEVDSQVPAHVLGDAERIRQILVNLVGNAMKFTTQGSVLVQLACDEIDRTGTMALRFTVTDTGIGIPADRMDCLFKAFSQTDASTTRPYGGTGLGLIISKKLAEFMGGSIGVRSAPGRGSTFWFQVQVAPSVLVVTTDASETTAERDVVANSATFVAEATALPTTAKDMEQSITERTASRARILIAEDNEINRIVACEILREKGFECHLAEDGRAAVEAIRGGRFDIVLMDCQMPNMDGFEATRAIRALEREREAAGLGQRHVPILALTANAMRGDPKRCLEAGMDAYASKPIDPSQLEATIESLIEPRTDLISMGASR